MGLLGSMPCVKGEWVALLDADDIWLPTKLEAQIAAAASENPECEVIGTQCSYFGTLSGSPRITLGSIPRKATFEANPNLTKER